MTAVVSRRWLGPLCRWLWYLSLSYLWLGLMFLLFIHQATSFFWWGLPAAVIFWRLAKALSPHSFGTFGKWTVHFLCAFLLIGGQVLLWRYGYFFRDPERVIPSRPAILAPADGFIVYIRPVSEGMVPLAIKNKVPIRLEEILKMESPIGESVIVGIFMTPMSVHINRSPINGVIQERAYFTGEPMRSMLPMGLRTMFLRKPFEAGSEHILRNERETLLIRGDFPVLLTRIADPFVDKIVTWKTIGETVRQGERLGLIKMGSQTDLVFPSRMNGKPVRVYVKEGQYVYAGSTILADYDGAALAHHPLPLLGGEDKGEGV